MSLGGAFDRKIGHWVSAFDPPFGPGGREFEQTNLKKFKCPGVTRGGGGGGILNFRVDRCTSNIVVYYIVIVFNS